MKKGTWVWLGFPHWLLLITGFVGGGTWKAGAQTGSTSVFYTSGTAGRIADATFNIANFTWAAQTVDKMKSGDAPEPPTYYVNESRFYGRSDAFFSGSLSRLSEIQANYGDVEHFLWHLVPDTKIPRYASRPNFTPTIPGTGGDIVWAVDPIARPYKVRDLGSGTSNSQWYPKNDFFGYYKHGLDANQGGRFNAVQANGDASFLNNPEDTNGPGPNGFEDYVDHDYGEGFPVTYVSTGTTQFPINPIRVYSKFVYTAYTVPLLNSFSHRALVETGTNADLCAYYGLLLLSRLAYVYPDYREVGTGSDRHWVYEQTDADAIGDTGSTDNGGMITGKIWETYGIESFSLAYDALKPWLYSPGNPSLRTQLLNFLQLKGLSQANSAAGLDAYLRARLIQPAMDALERHKIVGNPGMHQSAGLAAAMVFDQISGTAPNTKTTVDAFFKGYKGLNYLGINSLWRDGGPYESVGYGDSWLKMVRMNQYMDVVRQRFSGTFPTSAYPDLFAGEKGKAIFDFFADIAPQERFTPAFGDTASPLLPVIDPTPRLLGVKEYYYAWEKLEQSGTAPKKYSRYLRAAGLAGTVTSGSSTWPGGELFAKFPGQIERDANTPLDWNGNNVKIIERPRLMAAYGVGLLEQGKGDGRRSLLLNYTSLTGHRQFDPLTIEMSARNLQLLPDLGYPKDLKNYRWQYDAHTMGSNTVTVDETRGTFGGVYLSSGTLVSNAGISLGQGRLMVRAGPLQVIQASADPYPPGYYNEPFRWSGSAWQDPSLSDMALVATAAQNVTIYDRTDAMVEIDPARSYVVDVFCVNGGSVHDQSWHSHLQAPVDPPLTWTVLPATSTLAVSASGTAVARFGEYKDQWGRYNVKGHFPSYTTGIKTGTLSGTTAATWVWTTTTGSGSSLRLDTLRIHAVPVDASLKVIRCTASAPNRLSGGVYEEMPYLLLRQNVVSGTRTRYVSVLEHHSGTSVAANQPAIQSVTLVDKPAGYVTLEIVHTQGKDRVTVATPVTPSGTTDPRAVGARLQRWANTSESVAGTASKTVDLSVGEPLGTGTNGFIQAAITQVEPSLKRIRIANTAANVAACVSGRQIRIYNSERSSLHRIVDSGTNPTDILVTLERTPVLAVGSVAGIVGERVNIDGDIEFANGTLTTSGTHEKKPWITRDHVAGAWLGQAAPTVKLRGSVQTGSSETNDPGTALFLPPGQTYSATTGTPVTVYEYGVGDMVEIPKVTYQDELPRTATKTFQLVLPSGSGQAYVEVSAWLKQVRYAGYNRALKVKWNGTYLSGTGRPGNIVMQNSGSTTTNSSINGQLLPYCPDPDAIAVDNPYYFRMETAADLLNMFDLVTVRFPISSPVSGTHSVIIENASGTGVTQPMVIGDVQARWGDPLAP